jgi:hypothetical protein
MMMLLRAPAASCTPQVLQDGIEAYAKVDASVPTYAKYTPTFKF